MNATDLLLLIHDAQRLGLTIEAAAYRQALRELRYEQKHAALWASKS